MQNKNIATFCLATLKQLGAQKAQVNYEQSITREMSYANGQVYLLRTLHKDDIYLRAIIDNKEAKFASNKIDPESLYAACQETINLASSSPPDAAKDIAPQQEIKVFHHGEKNPNFDLMHERLLGFSKEVNRRYPKIRIREVLVAHNFCTAYFLNSNGVDVETNNGSYVINVLFLAKDGIKTSSFNYEICNSKNLDLEFIDWGMLDDILSQTEKQTELRPVPEKSFIGDIILTPSCLLEMNQMLAEHLRDGKHITNSSLFLNKLGEKVVSEKFTLHSNPIAADFAEHNFITTDGYITQNLVVFEKGVLKSNLLSQYAANKTNQARGLNYGVNYKIDCGDQSLEDIIRSVKKGILLYRLSGGYPASNGDFSGVAKNSFYIENGEIKYPINETMITTNVLDLFNNIHAISKESVNYGHSIMPWMRVGGVTVSGK
ncbi:MAG TPA: metallopeptidase TldD-related protein [Bacteriovoracaceae bacterium]|nr:metallopeptidase TldD-related protein [Bacteriovoracaceae bacterium]